MGPAGTSRASLLESAGSRVTNWRFETGSRVATSSRHSDEVLRNASRRDAWPIVVSARYEALTVTKARRSFPHPPHTATPPTVTGSRLRLRRSEEHTSELQSQS